MKRTKKNSTPAVRDSFLGLFEHVQEGDRIAFVDGPGCFGTWDGSASRGVVKSKGENRWGRFIMVEVEGDFPGVLKDVSCFTEVGIGAYYLGRPPAALN